MLEYFVHLDKDDPPDDLVLAVAEVPKDLGRERIEVSKLPPDWRETAAPAVLSRIGDEFAKRRKYCLLLLPSVLAPSEHNCLINPEHPDYKRITVRTATPLNYDRRMFGTKHRRRD